jgi:hypothetical protein
MILRCLDWEAAGHNGNSPLDLLRRQFLEAKRSFFRPASLNFSPEIAHSGCKICLAGQKNAAFFLSKPACATSLFTKESLETLLLTVTTSSIFFFNPYAGFIELQHPDFRPPVELVLLLGAFHPVGAVVARLRFALANGSGDAGRGNAFRNKVVAGGVGPPL